MTLKFVQDAMGTKWKEIIYFEISIYMYLAKWTRLQPFWKHLLDKVVTLSDEGKQPRWGASAAGVASIKENVVPSREVWKQLQELGTWNGVAATGFCSEFRSCLGRGYSNCSRKG